MKIGIFCLAYKALNDWALPTAGWSCPRSALDQHPSSGARQPPRGFCPCCPMPRRLCPHLTCHPRLIPAHSSDVKVGFTPFRRPFWSPRPAIFSHHNTICASFIAPAISPILHPCGCFDRCMSPPLEIKSHWRKDSVCLCSPCIFSTSCGAWCTAGAQ